MENGRGVPSEPHVEWVAHIAEQIRNAMARVVVGQAEAVDGLLIALFAGGHVLLEGVPGLAKTLLVRSLAQIVDGVYIRVQFTPDLMPSDITGTLVFDPRTAEFHIRKGPVFANLLLADEINRTAPKTQAALLEATEEGHVTISGEHHALPEPFLVAATQNPVEYEGTYPLPEAQLDRFLLKIVLTYPTELEDRSVLEYGLRGVGAAGVIGMSLQPIIAPAAVLAAREVVAQVVVSEAVIDYAARLVRTSREHPSVYLGASPRGGIMLLRAARAAAAMEARDFVVPDDIQRLAEAVLRHRLLLQPESEIEGITPEHVIGDIIRSVEVPR